MLPKADPGLAAAWWTVLLLRGILPAAFAIAMGVLVGAVQHGHPPGRTARLCGRDLCPAAGAQPHPSGGQRQPGRPHRRLALRPAHRGLRAPAGHRASGRSDADQRPHRGPRFRPGDDRAAAFHLHGLHCHRHGRDDRRPGLGRRSSPRYAWWAPLLLAGAWLATHWLLRESAIWRDRNTEEVRAAQRDADYAYRLAVDPPASKELRLFGLAGWTIDRFIARRTRLHELQYAATRMRERPVLWSLLLVTSAQCARVLAAGERCGPWPHLARGSRGLRAERHRRVDDRLRRIQLGARRIGRAGGRGAAAGAGDASRRCAAARALAPRRRAAPEIRLRDVTLRLPGRRARCWSTSISPFPPAPRWPSWARMAPARPPSPSCCAACTIPSPGPSTIDGVDLREFDLASWRARVTAVFQDFIRLELPLRDNVAPAGAPDDVVRAALEVGGRSQPGRARHRAGPRIQRRHGPFRRPVAARRARPGAGRRHPRRRRGAAR